MSKRVRIVSDGTPEGTIVFGPNAVEIPGVSSVFVFMKEGKTTALVRINDVEIDAVAPKTEVVLDPSDSKA